MGLVTPTTFRRWVSDLSSEQFLSFVAALWTARGAETTVDADARVVEVRRDGRTCRLRVVTGRRAPTDRSPEERLVLSRPASSVGDVSDGTRVTDVNDLHAMLLYGVPRSSAETLCQRFFDRPLATDRRPPERSVTDRVSGHSASVVVGLLGITLVVMGVLGGPGLFGGDSVASVGAPDSVGSDASATPMPTPTETATPTQIGLWDGRTIDRATLPAGLGPDGVVDADTVADTHAKRVTGQSYRLTLTYREYVDGQTTAYRRETVYVASPTEYRTELTGAGRLREADMIISSVEAYADGDSRYERRVEDDGFDRPQDESRTVRGVQNGEGRYADRVEQYLGWYLSVSESSLVDVVERDGTRYFWVSLGEDPYPGVANSTGSALVDENGVVHEVHRRYDIPESRGVSAEVSIRYTDIGTTTVDPPAWHDGADATTTNETTTAGANQTVTPTPTGT